MKRIEISHRVACAVIQGSKLNLGLGKDAKVIRVQPCRGGKAGPGSLRILYTEGKK